MTKVYVCFDADESEILAVYGGAQSGLNLAHYAEIESDDPRYVAWYADKVVLFADQAPQVLASFVKPGD